MNLAFNECGKYISPCLRIGMTQLLLRRSSCKIAVELENKLVTQLENNELKPRHHPGIVKAGRTELPSYISQALKRVIGEHPIKTVLKDCQQLNKYLNSRHPPAEPDQLKLRMRRILDEVDERMPLANLEGLSEEEQSKWRYKRQQYIDWRMAQRTYAWKPVAYGAYEALIYAIGRGALDYAVLLRILKELAVRDADFKPRSYFDFGSGIGTGMWAASQFWQDSIYEYYNVDSSREMHDLSDLILRDGNENQQQLRLRNVFYRQFLPGLETKYDLIISSYSLFELPGVQSRREVLLNLWRKCNGYLVIIEEGTRRGSELVNEARKYILSLRDEQLRGHVFAPCAHSLPCPRLANKEDRTPCNFETTYVPLHIGDVKADSLVARYSYVVLKKGTATDVTQNWPRLVRPTLVRSKHVICRMCTANAELQEIIFTQSKHSKSAYKCARVSKWGDRLPMTILEPLDSATQEIEEEEKEETVVEAVTKNEDYKLN